MTLPGNNPVLRLTGDQLLLEGLPPNAQFLAAATRYEWETETVENPDGSSRTVRVRVPTDDHDLYFVVRSDFSAGGATYQSLKDSALADLQATDDLSQALFNKLAGTTGR